MEGIGFPVSLSALMGGAQPDEQDNYDRAGERDQKRRERFTPEQARSMLREALVMLDHKHEFERGQLVRFKQGLEASQRAFCGGVAVFLEYGQNPYPQELAPHGRPLGAHDDDCRIGVILPNGAMAEYMSCSRYLEPDPDA